MKKVFIKGCTQAILAFISTSLYAQVASMNDLTSPTAGRISSSTCTSSTSATNVFDNRLAKDQTARWLSQFGEGTNAWIQYEFTDAPRIVDAYRIYGVTPSGSVSASPKSFRLEGANDASTWIELDRRTNFTKWTDAEPRICYFNNSTPYSFYRLTITENNGNNSAAGLSELEFFYLNGLQIPSNDDIATIGNGVITDNSSTAGDPTLAFDNGSSSETSRWSMPKGNADADGIWLKYEFIDGSKIVDAYRIFSPNTANAGTARSPKSFSLEGSNDDENWTILHTTDNQTSWGTFEWRAFTFKNKTAYQFYRLTFHSNNNGTAIAINELEMYYIGNETMTVFAKDLTTKTNGTITYSPSVSGSGATKLFDNGLGVSGSYWNANNNSTPNKQPWVIFQFNEGATCVNAYRLYARRHDSYLDRAPKDFMLEGSADGENWVLLDEQQNQTGWGNEQMRLFCFENSTPYLYYRFTSLQSNGSSTQTMLAEIEFLELDYKSTHTLIVIR